MSFSFKRLALAVLIVALYTPAAQAPPYGP
jgi:hypothetical protein